MNNAIIAQCACFAAFLLAAQFRAGAQDGFTDDAVIKTFLRDNFDGKRVGMVIVNGSVPSFVVWGFGSAKIMVVRPMEF